MKTDNRTKGGRFEQELSVILYRNGFWAHVMQQNKSGQPADIIAVKKRFHTLIDAKVVDTDKGFELKRVEENQALAMRLFCKRCGEMCYFAVRYPDGKVYMLPYTVAEDMARMGEKRLTEEVASKVLMDIEAWIKATDLWSEDV